DCFGLLARFGIGCRVAFHREPGDGLAKVRLHFVECLKAAFATIGEGSKMVLQSGRAAALAASPRLARSSTAALRLRPSFCFNKRTIRSRSASPVLLSCPQAPRRLQNATTPARTMVKRVMAAPE